MVTARTNQNERSTLEVVRAIAGGAWVQSASRSSFADLRCRTEEDCGEIADEQGNYLLIVTDSGLGDRDRVRASRLALDTLREEFSAGDGSPEQRLRRALLLFSQRLRESASSEAGGALQPHLAALLLTPDGHAWVAWLGEVRAYAWRRGQLALLSDAHCNVPAWLDLRQLDVEPADRFLLCSERLAQILPEDELARIVGLGSPVAAAQRLVKRAGERGAEGNINVQVAALAGRAIRLVEPQPELEPEAEPAAAAFDEPEEADDLPELLSRSATDTAPTQAESPRRRKRARRPAPRYVRLPTSERRQILASSALAAALLMLATPLSLASEVAFYRVEPHALALSASFPYRELAFPALPARPVESVDPALLARRTPPAHGPTSFEIREAALRVLYAEPSKPVAEPEPVFAAAPEAALEEAIVAEEVAPVPPPELALKGPWDGREDVVQIEARRPFGE